MGFDPNKPFEVVSTPAPAPSGFDPNKPFEVVQPQAPEPAPAPGRLESFGRGALQGASLGFSDELTGAIESLFSDKSYRQARDEARANNAAASEAHPYLYGGGELAGGLAGAAVPGAALAKGAALAGEGTAIARGLGAASKVAQLATGTAPEGAGLANVAARSALAGGVAGLGSSDADTLGGAAKDVGVGALAGGVTGAALHAVGSKLAKKAPENFEKELNTDLFAKSRPKDYLQASRVQEANPAEFREMVYSKEFAPVQKLARAGKTAEAKEAADEFVNKATANRLHNYAEVAADGYKTDPGPVVDRMEKLAAAKAANGAKEEAKAISDAAQEVRSRFSTIDRSVIKEGDRADDLALAKLKQYLPERETLTKAEFQDAAIKLARQESGNARANYGDVADDVHKAIENLRFSYDPKSSISLVELRKAATDAQNATKATLGSIAETEHYRIVRSVDDAINSALDAHLDSAAKSSQRAADAVARIRHDNKIISMALAARDGLDQKLTKESIGKGSTLASRASDTVSNLAHVGAVGAAAISHNPYALGLAAAPHALKAVGKGARVANDTLARFIYAASQGNQYAQRTISALAQTPAGAARIAALKASGNLSQ